jgi:hypothetical protein
MLVQTMAIIQAQIVVFAGKYDTSSWWASFVSQQDSVKKEETNKTRQFPLLRGSLWSAHPSECLSTKHTSSVLGMPCP